MDPPEGEYAKKNAWKNSATAPGAYFERENDVELQLLPEFKDQVRLSRTEDSAPHKSKKDLYRPIAEPPYEILNEVSSSDRVEISSAETQPSSGPRYKDQVAAEEREPTRSHPHPHAVNNLQATKGVTSASNHLQENDFLVSARVVEESALRPLAQAVPVQEINKRRAEMCLGLVFIIMVVIIISTVLLVPNKTGESKSLSETPSEPPIINATQHPTEASTDLDIEWMQLGFPLDETWSEDQAGHAVAISRNGLSVAVGAPGADKVRIYRFKEGDWHEVATIDSIINTAAGTSVAMDDTGLIVAIGAPFPLDENVSTETPNLVTSAPSIIQYGSVRVFEINKTATGQYGEITHTQIGSDIIGPEMGSEFGWSVDISGTGDILAIGSRAKCYVKVVRFSEETQDWLDFGNPIDCNGTFDNSFGASVRLSAGGTILAVGAPVVLDNEAFWSINDIPVVDDTRRSGRVRVYQHNGTSWTMMGNVIEGEAEGDGFGSALAFSDDGAVLASCAPFNDAGRDPSSTPDSTRDPSYGSCRVYKYSDQQDSWQQRGQDIDGEFEQDKFGISVSMDATGSVIAIGAIGSNENGDDSGHVRVFQLDEENKKWVQVGKDIPSPFLESVFGRSVALSADGDLVIVGSPNNILVNDDHKGGARVYETGIEVKSGDFPIEVSIHTGEYPNDLGWELTRLDVEREETFQVFSVPIDTYKETNRTVTTNVTVPEGGVFMFAISEDDGWYEISFPGENANDLTIVREAGNFSTRKTHTFQAVKESKPSLGQAVVTLVIDFDDYPEEFHWVFVQSDLVMDSESTKLKSNRTVLAFGPQQEYSRTLAGSQQIETIDVSLATAQSTLKLIITDDGRDGLCCEFGTGMFRLYNGSHEENNEDNLLVNSTAEGKR